MRWHGVAQLTWVLVGLAVWSGKGMAYLVESEYGGATFTLNVPEGSASVGRVGEFVVEASTVKGRVKCNYSFSDRTRMMYHRSFINLPWDASVGRYRINKNLSMSYSSGSVPDTTWGAASNVSEWVCGVRGATNAYSESLANAFPITLTFYLDKRPIDNLITVPAMVLGGYVRMFEEAAPVGQPALYTIPFNLQGGTIMVPAICEASSSTIQIDHGTLASDLKSHIATQQLTYSCSTPIKASIEISYQENANGLLDLKDSTGVVRAQTKLTVMDNETRQKGKEISTEINQVKSYTVSSELSNITGEGAIQGSAWIIALMD
ncbi:hypothetical protein [Serratia fonticola]